MSRQKIDNLPTWQLSRQKIDNLSKPWQLSRQKIDNLLKPWQLSRQKLVTKNMHKKMIPIIGGCSHYSFFIIWTFISILDL